MDCHLSLSSSRQNPTQLYDWTRKKEPSQGIEGSACIYQSSVAVAVIPLHLKVFRVEIPVRVEVAVLAISVMKDYDQAKHVGKEEAKSAKGAGNVDHGERL
jgi:hypothetical protein